MSAFNCVSEGCGAAVAVAAAGLPAFRRLPVEEIPRIASLLEQAPWRTCDFTIGGIYMWADYFHYTGAIVDDTLLIKGVSERDRRRTAFSLPVGRLPLRRSVDMLRRHCDERGMALLLSAVPEDAVAELTRMGASVEAELTDWADYLYDIRSMATFAGKRMAKKRNHVNAFMASYPDMSFGPLCGANLPEVRRFYESMTPAAGKGPTALVDREQTLAVLADPERYPFEGAVLSVLGEGVVAFTLGEVRGDTLFVHVEKMRHDIAGAGETVCRLFAALMAERHPSLLHVNREEDAGDEGLRRAKESYHPEALLRKYDLVFR